MENIKTPVRGSTRDRSFYMEHINNVLKARANVNVDNYIKDNVYDENVAKRIQEAIDKPRAIAEIIAEELNAPNNTKLYIKLVYEYSEEVLFKCLALTKEAHKDGLIRTTRAQYFYGIVRRQRK